jgi:hypothetical protein
MIVYRFENIHDGGGPFCLPDGRMRHRLDSRFEDTGISGCASVDLLLDYFSKSAPDILTELNYKIVQYQIDESQIISRNQREIVFKI